MNNKNLFLVAIVAVVNALGYGIIIPVLYTYSQKFGLSDFQNGLLFSIFSLFQLISTPIIGRLSDKYGRKPLLAISLIGSAISFFMMAFAPSAIFLFIARALDGITAGNIPVISAIISDTTDEKNRGKGFAILGASFGFGFVFGPAIASLTVGINAALPFIIAGIVSSIAVLLTFVILKETNVHIGEVKSKNALNFKALFKDLGDKNISYLLIILFLYTTGFNLFIYAFQPFAIRILNIDVVHISWIFTGIGIMGIIAQGFIFPQISKRFNLRKVYIVSLILLSIIFLTLSFSNSYLFFTSVLMLMALTNSFVGPLSQTFLSQTVDSKSQGSIQGLGSTFTSIGQIIGPILGGFVSSYALKYSFVVSSLLIFICVYFAVKLLHAHFVKESAF
jgi:MFS family permease